MRRVGRWEEVGGGGGGSDPRASGPGGGTRGRGRRAGRRRRRGRGEELRPRRGETAACGMSAHHVVAVDAVRGVLHAVVDFPPEHRQVLGEPAGEGWGGEVELSESPIKAGKTASYLFEMNVWAQRETITFLRDNFHVKM